MKYIMMTNGMRYYPIIFPKDFVHRFMAGAVQGMLGGDKFLRAIAAGDYDPVSGTCSGESETMKLKSRGKIDSDIIAHYPYFHGAI